jgi:hypothetical protein
MGAGIPHLSEHVQDPYICVVDCLQGGGVGLLRRDKFIDGALTLTRPVYKRFSAGFGVWGGAQRGLCRVDAGPRVTMRVRKS